MSILDQSFFACDTCIVAQELIGCYLVHELNGAKLIGKIVETEAYLGLSDPASHAYRGKTDRNAPMFGPVGHAYVYISYGIHYCFNIVARVPQMSAGGVLIRALEPVEGIEIMKKNRGLSCPITITNGPGKLTQAMGITLAHKGMPLTQESKLYLFKKVPSKQQLIIRSERVGISQAKDKPWRFYLADNKWVSKK